MKFRVMQINDVHLADQPPRMRADEYREQILAKLEAAMSLVHQRQVDHVVITGDLFHRHQAAHTSHGTVQRVRAILNAPGVPVSLVVGNHDRARGGALEGQPLLSVLGDNVTLLEGPHPVADIAGFGWTNELAGTEEEIEAFLAQGRWKVERSLVFVHAPIVPEPFPFGPAGSGWIELQKVVAHLHPRTRYLGHGHIHGGHPPVYSPWLGPLTVANPGALSRATIAGDDRSRTPQVALVTLEEGVVQVNYIPIPHVPVEEAFRMELHEREVERGDNIAVLAQALLEGALHVVTADTLIDAVRQVPAPDEIGVASWANAQERAVRVIDEVSA